MAKHSVLRVNFTASFWRIAAVISFVCQASYGQRVVVDAEVEAFAKESVNLPCKFIDPGNTKLTQVSWIYEATEGDRINIAVYHPQYGASFPESQFKNRVRFTQDNLKSPSIEITNMGMADEGRYTCEYATYPTGNEQSTTNLIMLAKPRNTAKAVKVRAGGTAAVVVASCEAALGKPPATITWEGELHGGRANTTREEQSDGTVTVRSEYMLTPSTFHNNHEIRCRVTQRAQDHPQTFPLRLSVEYSPVVSIVGYDDNWYMGRTDAALICQADANPIPSTVHWTTASGALPDTVEVAGNRLQIKRVDESVNTTFMCEVKNTLGAGKDQLTTMVIESSEDPSNAGILAGAILGSLLALLLVAALVAVLVMRSRRQQRNRGYAGDGEADGFGNKVRLFGMGSNGGSNGNGIGNGGKANKNGSGSGNNNNGPMYSYREGDPEALDEKPNDLHAGSRGPSPEPHHILLGERDEAAERRKLEAMYDSQGYEEEEDDDEAARRGYDGYSYHHPHHQHQPYAQAQATLPSHLQQHHDTQMSYLDDDMESQRDGSVISRTAIYV